MSDSGWKIVPATATGDMLNAGFVGTRYDAGHGSRAGVYRALINAAPDFEPSDAHVEAVARALCAAAGHASDAMVFKIGSFVGLPGSVPQWQNFTGKARAAISALIKAMEVG